MKIILQILIRTALAVVIGMIIGSERARHGRAAGMRTHILVALGAALTSMISIFAKEFMGYDGDVLRLSAQVISGVGFLGAGMIIHRKNNIISGLTTAAGVWTTSVIGIAVGCGFYFGALVTTLFYMLTIILLGKLEHHRKQGCTVYIEIDDMSSTNKIIKQMQDLFGENFTYRIVSARSGNVNHLGIDIAIEKSLNYDITQLCEIEHVVYVDEE